MMTLNLEDLVDLAMEVESDDPIDWGYLAIKERDAYRLIASTVLEKYLPYVETQEGHIIFLATIVKLIVENFVLNLQLLEQAKNKNVQ